MRLLTVASMRRGINEGIKKGLVLSSVTCLAGPVPPASHSGLTLIFRFGSV